MIIFAKADGTVIETKPTPFYQGSSLKGSIYLVAPFPNTNGVTIQFQLPNGNVTKAYPMTPTGEVEGVMLDGYEVSAWTWDVKNAMVTAIPGVVAATITVFNGEPNITYYGDYATFTAIDNIEKPQTNAYAFCRADGKVYKYNGENWVEGDIAISANDYVKTTIISSFPIIKGTPNALDVSTPSASEWEAIISALNEIGGKVTKPLMTNFTYNIATGESEKTYNNGMVQTENFPAVLPNTMTEYQSFTKTVFYASNWENSDRQNYTYMYTFELPTLSGSGDNFAIEVYSLDDSGYKKMNPIVVVNLRGSAKVSIYSNETYSGYALFFWKGSFAEQNYKEEIEKAIDDCEGATAQAENIANTLETAYENGELGIPNGGTTGQFLKKTETGTAWQDFLPNVTQNANNTIIVDGSVVNGNWNATFILQQGGKQRPICMQYTNHTGAKAEMLATANSAKFKFVNGSTDPQSYMEIFEDKINFSKPITVQNNPVGGGSGGGDYYITAQVVNLFEYYAYPTHYIVLPTNVSKIVLEKVVYMYASNNSTPYLNTIDVNANLNEFNYVTIPYLNGVVSENYEWLYDETINVSFEYASGIFSAATSSELDDRLIKTSYFLFRVTP